MTKKELELKVRELEKRIADLEPHVNFNKVYITIKKEDFSSGTSTANPDWKLFNNYTVC